MLTVTHAQLGTPSFGITPGDASLYCTLRATTETDLAEFKAEVVALASRLAGESGLGIELTWRDEFPATPSHDGLVDLLRRTAEAQGRAVREAQYPMRWSEDFGHFARICPTLYFGLGIGDAQPLHHPSYRFHDPSLITGVELFEGVVRQLLDT